MGKHYEIIGKDMLALISVINELFPKTNLFGMTSHYRLVVLENDDAFAWFIIISAVAGQFHFSYLLPQEKAPWQNAYVTGTANSLKEVKRFLLIAMRECKGWESNLELKQRLHEHNLQLELVA